MDIRFKRDLDKSYMIISGEKTEVGYEKNVLSANEIRALLSFYTVEVNGAVEFWYDITGAKTLKDYILQYGATGENIARILFYIKMCFEDFGKYLISDKHILLTEESVFIFLADGEFRMALTYYPSVKTDALKQLVNVFAFLMEVVNADDETAQTLVYRLYEMSADGAGIDEMLRVANECCSESDVASEESEEAFEEPFRAIPLADSSDGSQMPVEKKECISAWDKSIALIISFAEKIKRFIIMKKEELFPPKKQPVDFVYEPNVNFDEPTVLLSSGSNELEGRLLYEGEADESDYLIKNERFTIGTNSKNNAILHSKAVSRFHGVIERDETGSYYIEDLNSTNGTFVNGEALDYKSKKKLSQMDEIMFADVCYRIV